VTLSRNPRSGVIQTRSGRYRVAWIPIPVSPIPGYIACHVQAVRDDSPGHAVRLTIFERIANDPDRGSSDGPRAA
jgi:hypothetical protein